MDKIGAESSGSSSAGATLHKGADPSKYDVDIEAMIDKSGCSGVYYALEECLGAQDRDWTKCQTEVKALKACALIKKSSTMNK